MKVRNLFRVHRVSRSRVFPPALRSFYDALLRWYHAHGKHLSLTRDAILARCPTVLVEFEGGTVLIQKRSATHSDFCIDVFNKDGAMVDSRFYMYPEEGKRFSRSFPPGCPVVNAAKPMRFPVFRRWKRFRQPALRV